MTSRRLRLLIVVALLVGGGWGVYRLAPRSSNPLSAVYEALDRRDFAAALAVLEQHLRDRPKDYDARLLAVQTARRLEDWPRAAEHARHLSDAAAYDGPLGHEFRLAQAQRGNLAVAQALAAEHLDRPDPDPLVAEAVARGVLHHYSLVAGAGLIVPGGEQPNVAVGIRAAECWLGRRPGPADQVAGRVWRGRLRALAGDHPGAVADLREALRLHPEADDAAYHLAVVLSQSDPAEAARLLEPVLARRPADIRVRYSLIHTYRYLGRFEDAARLLDPLTDQNPHDAAALTERGLLALDQGRADEAEPFLRQAVRLAPGYAEAHLALGRCLQMTGRHAEAAPHFEQFRRLDAARTTTPSAPLSPSPFVP